VDRASAFRGLLQMLHFGLERTLGAADPARPVLSRPWPVHLFDYGAGNPDAVYRTAVLRDDLTCRVSGVLGNAPFLSLEFFDGTRQTGSLLRSDLRADADGRFEVTFGPEERPGNWLAVVPGTSYLLTREFFDDWSGAEPSRLEIECLDTPASSWPVMTADRVSKELEALGQWLVETVSVFGNAQVRGVREFANAFKPTAVRADSDLPTIYHGFWDLAADECLIIETPAPEGDYWGFQLSNALWNTLDYANRQTSLNRTQAHVDQDGALRLVLAHQDPGVPNWLDTLGHEQGAIHVRLSPVRRARPVAPGPGRDRRRLDVRLGSRHAGRIGCRSASRTPGARRQARRPPRRAAPGDADDPPGGACPDHGGAAAPGHPDAAELTGPLSAAAGTRADSASRRASGIAVGLRDSRSTYTWTKWPDAAGWSEPAAWSTIS
jgi:hypothetical protein